MFYGLYITKTAQRELLRLPASDRELVREAIDRLCSETETGQSDIEPIRSYPGFFRLRVGSWRVFFRRKDALEVHAVRRRRTETYRRPFSAGAVPAGLGESALSDLDLPLGEDAGSQAGPELDSAAGLSQDEALVAEPPIQERLQLDAEFLAAWGVPEEYFSSLSACQDPDALLALEIPAPVIERVMDGLYPPSLDRTQQEPQYQIASSKELDDFLSGRVSDLLLRLDTEQEQAASWRLRGPALVRGGPGTGKTVVALYRVLQLARNQPGSRVLLATYTRTLTHYSEQLLTRLLEQRGLSLRLEVRTVDSLVQQRVNAQLALEGQPLTALKEVLAEMRNPTLFRLGERYLLDEFTEVIEDCGLDQAGYLAFPRSGRKQPLAEADRQVVWAAYSAWTERLARKGKLSIGRARMQAAELARPAYDAVIADEIQDLSPVLLRLLLRLAYSREGLYLTGDANQTLYSGGFSFRGIDEQLDMRGRSLVLRRNYRSTKQIHALLTAIAQHPSLAGEELPGAGGQEGRKPGLVLCGGGHLDGARLAELIRGVCLAERLPYAGVAVLCPDRKLASQVAGELRAAGLPADMVKGDRLELDAPAIKVLTLHSAKGLEFPAVFLLDVSHGVLPQQVSVPLPERAGYQARFRKLFYVGCSRAMRSLVLTANRSSPSPFLGEIPEDLWERTEL